MAHASIPKTMSGVLLTGHGGPETLEYRTDLPVPTLLPFEVLIRVSAAAINNTDINTRIGWYSKGVTGGTSSEVARASGQQKAADSSWSGKALEFPRIQGADCCGRVVAVGAQVDARRIGLRVVVKNMLTGYTAGTYECWTFGSECDGAFAQYAKAPAADVYTVEAPGWSDVELASVPCAFSTAENMVQRSGIVAGETVVVTGAGGGVGAAAVQLCKRRGANVIAVASLHKRAQVLELGAQQVIARDESLVARLGKGEVDIVLDVVAGPAFPELLDVLRKGGRYATAGAIAGPVVHLDVRSLYLKNLSFFGCTYVEEKVFANLVSYIEKGEIRPHIGQVFKLQDIRKAQEVFQSKTISGKIVLEIE